MFCFVLFLVLKLKLRLEVLIQNSGQNSAARGAEGWEQHPLAGGTGPREGAGTYSVGFAPYANLVVLSIENLNIVIKLANRQLNFIITMHQAIPNDS